MARRDWAALVAVHSDAWLAAVAAFYAVKLDAGGRARLHRQTDALPTLFEVVTGRVVVAGGQVGQGQQQRGKGGARGAGGRSNANAAANANTDAAANDTTTPNNPPPPNFPRGDAKDGHASRAPNPAGRLLRAADIGPGLVGRYAELFWPDDALWYVVQIASVDARAHTAKIIYSTGEEEDDAPLDEFARDKQMSLLPASWS
jgi:hypothetical protein